MFNLFVYGTLKRNEGANHFLKDCTFIGNAITKDAKFNMKSNNGYFPFVFNNGDKKIAGEIYECPECDTIWIGSVDPAHVSNFRKYKSDGIRVPDAAEIDIAGVKYPAMENEKQTDFVCPKCKGNVIFGRIRTTDIDVLHCKRCNSVWLNSVCPENEINYREYLTSKEI